jgi:hypothetical protein
VQPGVILQGVSTTLACASAVLVATWGLVHTLATPRVVAGFHALSSDDQRIFLQEWLVEALAMWGTAAFVLAAIAAGVRPIGAVEGVAAGVLVALSVLTALTGARTRVIWFKICVILLLVAAGLLVGATLT